MTEHFIASYLLISLILQIFIPGFPKEVLMLQAGISYGWFIGGIINWVGMVIGAQVAYETMAFLESRGSKHVMYLQKFEENYYVKRLRKDGNYALFVFRLVPYAPNDLLSLASGFIRLPRRGFFLTSVITAVPYAFVFSYLGELGSEYIPDPDLLIYVNLALAILLVFFASIKYLYQRRNAK